MPMMKLNRADIFSRSANPRIATLVLIVAVQTVAAGFFLIDGIHDILGQAEVTFSFEIFMDCLVSFALLAGIAIGARYVKTTTDALHRKDVSLQIARGALAQHMARRFDEWGLTPGEAEIALFAMKGCNVGEIAALRNSASGTVRSQLSQIYAKAGVSSQSMLVSSFIEDLLELPTLK